MSLPDKNNPYTFDDFLEWRKNVDYYDSDPFLQKALKHFAGRSAAAADSEAREFSKMVSHRWRDFSEIIAWPEKHPYMVHFNGHNNRIDRIMRPMETEVMEKEIFETGLFSGKTSPWSRMIKIYLLGENGEACIGCPIACTEGMVALLKKFADTPELERILLHITEGLKGDFAIGAQYLSEIQGGSDVPGNLVEAVEEGGLWRLYGKKFFCAATHADYAVVTAKPGGSEKVALFLLPSWLPGDKEREKRNGCTIDRIKYKMGTKELPTAEITYDGAIAYPVGPMDRGVANVVGIVLTLSRLNIGLLAGAGMARGLREAKEYARFREAFGLKVNNFPMVAAQLEDMEKIARRTTAGAFKLFHKYMALPNGLMGGLDTNEPLDVKKKRFEVRELVMLQKITAAWDSVDSCRTAMSIFGGHGVMEDFSSLPRLYRDAAVNELWEGPRNVLLTQIHRDFQRAASWQPPAECIRTLLEGAEKSLVDDFAKEAEELVNYPNLLENNKETRDICRRWDLFCESLCHAYQDQALEEVLAAS